MAKKPNLLTRAFNRLSGPRSARYHHHISEAAILESARSLLKFCREHQYEPGYLVFLKDGITALEQDNFPEAMTQFQRIPFGGMGCFNDWYPPVIYDHENPAYVEEVFTALTERFCRLIMTAAGK